MHISLMCHKLQTLDAYQNIAMCGGAVNQIIHIGPGSFVQKCRNIVFLKPYKKYSNIKYNLGTKTNS